jgi:hypothetical protein
MMQEYRAGKQVTRSYEQTLKRLDAIYASDRLKLPLRGVLLVGYWVPGPADQLWRFRPSREVPSWPCFRFRDLPSLYPLLVRRRQLGSDDNEIMLAISGLDGSRPDPHILDHADGEVNGCGNRHVVVDLDLHRSSLLLLNQFVAGRSP